MWGGRKYNIFLFSYTLENKKLIVELAIPTRNKVPFTQLGSCPITGSVTGSSVSGVSLKTGFSIFSGALNIFNIGRETRKAPRRSVSVTVKVSIAENELSRLRMIFSFYGVYTIVAPSRAQLLVFAKRSTRKLHFEKYSTSVRDYVCFHFALTIKRHRRVFLLGQGTCNASFDGPRFGDATV